MGAALATAEMDREEIVAQLREQMWKAMGKAPPPLPGESVFHVDAEMGMRRPLVEARGGLAQIIPEGGFRRAGIIRMSGPPLLILELINDVSHGGRVAVIGCADLLYPGVENTPGVGNVIVIEQAHPEILGIVVEGCDLVVYRPASIQRGAGPFVLSPPLRARIRQGRAACVIWEEREVEGAYLRLDGEIVAIGGIGRGEGRIRSITLTVSATTTSGSRRGTLTVADVSAERDSGGEERDSDAHRRAVVS